MRLSQKMLFIAGLGLLLTGRVHADPTRPLEVIIAAGDKAQSRTSTQAWRDNRDRNFTGQRLRIFDNPRNDPVRIITRQRTVQHLQQADIYMYSGHANTTEVPGSQVLQLRPTGAGDNGFLTPADIRAALQGRRGPRLVIMNGCATMDPNDGVAPQGRISNAFAITDGMEGRTYLGWDIGIVGAFCDDEIGRLLTHWTTPDAQGVYPTIEQSMRHLNHPNLKRVGDPNLRYNIPFLIRSANPRDTTPPVRLTWKLTGENSAEAVLDLGADNERQLQALRMSRRLTFAATRTANGFEVRGQDFQRLVHDLLKGLADAFNAGGRSDVQVHEASLQIRGDGDNLRITVRVRATTTVTPANGQPRRDTIDASNELIATPEGNANRPRPPA